MRKTTLLLVLLLLATNLAWCLARPGAIVDAVSAPPPGSGAVTASEREAALAAELAGAKARIGELEARDAARTERTPAPAVATAQPDRAARDETRRLAAERSRLVQERMSAWVEAALQTTDVARRAAALEEMRQALLGNDPAAAQAALRALARLRELDYDKGAFRQLVLPCLRSEDAGIRAAALYALWNTAPDPSDLPALLAMVSDPSPQVRGSLAHVVRMYNGGALEGEAADVALKLLNDDDRTVRRSTMSGIGGGRVDQRIEQHFLDMLADRELRQEAVHFALSSFNPKSTRVVQALLTLATDANFEVASSARHGLGVGIEKVDQGAVADAFLQLLETRSDPGLVVECVEKLQRYGSARHVPALETYLARPGITAATRQLIEPLIQALRKR